MIRAACLSTALAVCGAVGIGFSTGQPALGQEVQGNAASAFAAEAPEIYRMLDGIGMYEIIALMGTENTRGARDLEDQLFPGAGGAAWQATVMQMHATDRMTTIFEEAFDRDALTPDQIGEALSFISSEAGGRVVAGELAARRMFLDEGAVEAATDVLMAAVADHDPRLDILQRFNEINGFVDRNVSGALNLRFTFYRGLADGGAFDNDVPEDMMLADVWANEPEVRQMTVEWLFSYQLAAYAEVSDADLEAYVNFSATPAGRALNAALFSAFDEMLASLSYDLGVAAATFIVGEDT